MLKSRSTKTKKCWIVEKFQKNLVTFVALKFAEINRVGGRIVATSNHISDCEFDFRVQGFPRRWLLIVVDEKFVSRIRRMRQATIHRFDIVSFLNIFF